MKLPARNLLAAIPVAALLLAGCGGDDSSPGDADLASVMPKTAALYVEGALPPFEDDEGLYELLKKVLRTDDPDAELRERIDAELREEDKTFAEDVEPWLGDRFAVAAFDLAADEPGFVAAIATDDPDTAADFLAEAAKEEQAQEATYKDTDYYVEGDGTAAGVVEGFAVVADTEARFKQAVDTTSGDGLDAVEAFESEVGDLPDDAVGALWLNPQVVADAAAASAGDEAAAGVVRGALEDIAAVTAFAEATGETAAIESRTTFTSEDKGLGALGAGGAPELLRSLPESAWAAAGIADVGESARTAIETVAGGLGSAVLGGQLREQLGVDLERDVLGWMGDAAFYVSGDSVARIGGALVVAATDESAAAGALPRIVQAVQQRVGIPFEDLQLAGADQAWAASLPGAPGPLVLARAGDRVVLALGDDTAAEALDPDSTLGDSDLFERAEAALDGLDPTLIVDGPTLVAIFEQATAGDPDFAEAEPYLEMLDLLAAGSAEDGDAVRQRLVAGIK